MTMDVCGHVLAWWASCARPWARRATRARRSDARVKWIPRSLSEKSPDFGGGAGANRILLAYEQDLSGPGRWINRCCCPPSVQDFVGVEHLARFVLALVLCGSGNYVSLVGLGGGGGGPAEPVSDGLRSLVTGRNTGRGDKTGLSCRPMRQENRGFSEAFQPDSLLDLTGSRTEENREAFMIRERLLKRRPFRVRVRSALPAALRCVQFNRSLAYYYNAAVQ